MAIGPGFMRTEAILEGFGVTETNWRDALTNPQAAAGGWGGSETPCFVGRAVAALAADPNVGRKNGSIFTTRSLSEEYGSRTLMARFRITRCSMRPSKRQSERILLRWWRRPGSRTWTGN